MVWVVVVSVVELCVVVLIVMVVRALGGMYVKSDFVG